MTRAALLAILATIIFSAPASAAPGLKRWHWPRPTAKAALISVHFDWGLDPAYQPIAKRVMHMYELTGDVRFQVGARADCSTAPANSICIAPGCQSAIADCLFPNAVGWWEATNADELGEGTTPENWAVGVRINATLVTPTVQVGYGYYLQPGGPYSLAQLSLCHEIGEAIGLYEVSDLIDDGILPPSWYYEPTCLTRDPAHLSDTPSVDDLAALHALYAKASVR